MRKSKTRTLLFGYMGQESVEEHEEHEHEEGENDSSELTPESSHEKPFFLSSNLTNDGRLACFLLLGGTSNNLLLYIISILHLFIFSFSFQNASMCLPSQLHMSPYHT